MKHREMYKWRTCSLYTYKSFMLKLWNIQQLLNYTLMKTSLIVLSYTQNLYDFSLKVRRMMSWSLFLLWIFLKLVLEVTTSESKVKFILFWPLWLYWQETEWEGGNMQRSATGWTQTLGCCGEDRASVHGMCAEPPGRWFYFFKKFIFYHPHCLLDCRVLIYLQND